MLLDLQRQDLLSFPQYLVMIFILEILMQLSVFRFHLDFLISVDGNMNLKLSPFFFLPADKA